MNPLARSIRPSVLRLSLLALAAASVPATAAEPVVEPVVELPPFLIVEAAEPLRWRYLEQPGWEMLTTCPPSTAREFAETYFRQERLIRTLVPARYLARSEVPIIVLLIDGETAKRLTDETMKRVMGADQPRVRLPWQQAQVMPNLRIDGRDRSVVLTLRPEGSSDEVVFAFTPGRFAHVLERMTPALPPWTAAGLIGFYERCIFGLDHVVVTGAAWHSPEEVIALADQPDWPREVWPLRRLISDPPDVSDAEAVAAWRTQAALFVRWALVADDGRRASAFWAFVDRCLEVGPSEAAFQECFGFGLAEARDRLSDYLPSAPQEQIALPRARLPSPPRARVRPATSLEVGRLRGEWERLAVQFIRTSRPDLMATYLQQARTTLARALAAAPGDPDLHALSGILEYDAGDVVAARRELEAAFAAGAQRPHAAYLLARLRFEEFTASLAGQERLNAAQTGFVLAPLELARRQRPALPEVYGLLAELWIRSSLRPTPEDLTNVQEGLRLFPVLPGIVGRIALLLTINGQADQALTAIDLSLARAAERPRRQAFQTIRRRLEDLAAAR